MNIKLLIVFLVAIPALGFAHEEEMAAQPLIPETVGHVLVIVGTLIAVAAGMQLIKKCNGAIPIIISAALIGVFHLGELLGGKGFEAIEHDAEHILNFVSVVLIAYGFSRLGKK